MKILLCSIFLISSVLVNACDCPPLPALTKKDLQQYDRIFYGTVDSVAPCDTKGLARAFFTIHELYKGPSPEHAEISFDCQSSCLMTFTAGEKWIIYGKFLRFDFLKVSFCENSRKLTPDESVDPVYLSTQRTFNNERETLASTFGLQHFAEEEKINRMQNDAGPRNEQPSPYGKLWLLVISAGVMIAIYFFTRLKKKS